MKNWSGKPKRHAVLAVALALVAVQGWAADPVWVKVAADFVCPGLYCVNRVRPC